MKPPSSSIQVHCTVRISRQIIVSVPCCELHTIIRVTACVCHTVTSCATVASNMETVILVLTLNSELKLNQKVYFLSKLTLSPQALVEV